MNASRFRVWPCVEVEDVLYADPMALEPAAVGVPGDHRGETITRS